MSGFPLRFWVALTAVGLDTASTWYALGFGGKVERNGVAVALIGYGGLLWAVAMLAAVRIAALVWALLLQWTRLAWIGTAAVTSAAAWWSLVVVNNAVVLLR